MEAWINGGLGCQLPSLILPLLLLPALIWTEEKLAQSGLSRRLSAGWAGPRARQDWPDGCIVLGFWLAAGVPLAPSYLKSLRPWSLAIAHISSS